MPFIGGGGGLSEEALAAAQPIIAIDGRVTALETQVVDLGAQDLFRGEWTPTPEELLYSQDFSQGAGDWTGGTVVPIADAIGTSKPNFTHAYQHTAPGQRDTTMTYDMTLDLTAVPALEGRLLTRATIWRASKRNSTSLNRTSTHSLLNNYNSAWSLPLSGGTAQETAWEEHEIANPFGALVARTVIHAAFNYLLTAYSAITGVEIYALPAGWSGYKYGDHVIHQGQMYRSAVMDNQDTPGTSESWVPVLSLPEPTPEV